MPVRYRSSTVKKETFHTVSLLTPHVEPGRPCSTSAAARATSSTSSSPAASPTCRASTSSTSAATGLSVPAVRRRDAAVSRSQLRRRRSSASSCTTSPTNGSWCCCEEALRVSRAKVVVVEDTPSTAFDRVMNRRHGESYRREIRSTASFGFLTAGEWRWLFRGMGLGRGGAPLSRFCQSILQPFARTAFVLRKSRAVAPA